jgi:hypothetical protein
MKVESKIETCNEPKIFARELRIYVQLPEPRTDHPKNRVKKMVWTAPKIYLIELIYALQCTGVFNNSASDIREITSFFEQTFSVDLGNVYNSFSEMRLRKKNRSSFLDLLKDRLIQRMDEADD